MAYAVYTGLNHSNALWVSGAPLSGTLTTAGGYGTTRTGDLAPGFTLGSVWAGHHGGADRYNYTASGAEVVRLPLRPTERILNPTVDIPEAGVAGLVVTSGVRFGFGCGYTSWGPNTCVINSPHLIKGGALRLGHTSRGRRRDARSPGLIR